jgi:hypothetical protein
MTRPSRPEHPAMPPGPPSTRVLGLLVAGHVVVLVGAVVVAALLMFDALADPTGSLPGGGVIAVVAVVPLAGGIGALGIGQILSIRRLRTHARAAAAGRLDDAALAAGVRRIAWPVGLALYPIILGLLHLALNPPPAALLAALTAVIAASLLLDHLHAGWAYRRLFHTTGTRPLPPGSRSRIHAGQRVTAVLYLGAVLAGALLLVATALTEIARPDPAPFATVVQLAAAATTTLVPLLLVRPVLRVSAAITTTPYSPDLADLAVLDRAAQSFIKLTSLSVLAAVLTAAALATAPADPAVAVGRVLPLLLVLGAAALQLGSLTSINLADTAPPAPGRRR